MAARRGVGTGIVLAGLMLAGAATAATVELVDGSTLVGVVACQADSTCVVTLNGGQRIAVPRGDIRRIAAGAAAAISPPPQQQMRSDLRVAGSNTIGARLMSALLIRYAKTNGAEATPDAPQVVATDEFRITPAPAPRGLWPTIEVLAHGTGSGFQGLAALAAGRVADETQRRALTEFAQQRPAADIAMASRRVKPNELEVLAPLGPLDEPASEQVLALDGLAVIVHPANVVETLTRDQIRRIFSGEFTDWSQVGGRPGPITRYARRDGSGTLDTFRDLVLEKQALAPATRIEDSADLSDAVARDPQAIGFIGMPYVRQAKALGIRECGLTYPPSTFNVKSEEYPLSRRLYLYIPGETSPQIHDFIAFTRTDAAQRIIAANDFVDLEIEPDATASQATLRAPLFARPEQAAPGERLARVMQRAQRLSLTLRFRANSGNLSRDLDSRAVHDLNRLVEYMKGPNGRGRRLMLFGYTDSDGAPKYNEALSRRRVASIRAMLESRNLTVAETDTIGFGADLPVACNDSDAGKARNRRVEIWISR